MFALPAHPVPIHTSNSPIHSFQPEETRVKIRQSTTLQSLRAARAFVDMNAGALVGVVDTGSLKRLGDSIESLAHHADDQSGSQLKAQGLTERQKTLRSELHAQMVTVARVARADLPTTPEFKALRLPRGRPAPERLKAAAAGMAQVAAEHVAVFTAAGLPNDFVAQLTAAAQAVLDAVDDRKLTSGKRSGATAGLARQVAEGKRVLAILDALVTRALRDNAPLLANWKSVIRVPRTATTVSATPVEATPSSTPTVAA